MAFAKKASNFIPLLKDQGMDYLAGATAPGVSIQVKQITQSGAAPCVVSFAAEGMSDMADTSYVVIVGGETAAAATVDQSTIATTGFNIIGGADTEVLHVVVIGRVKGQAA
jgi:hypothetical protein